MLQAESVRKLPPLEMLTFEGLCLYGREIASECNIIYLFLRSVLFVGKGKLHSECPGDLSFTGSPPKWSQRPGLDQVETRIMKFCTGVPLWVTGP